MLWSSQVAQRWPNRAYSRHVTVARQLWHVQDSDPDADPSQKPTLLMLHGTGAATHSWARLMPLLAPHFRCFAPDLPGHGFSGPLAGRKPTIENFAAAVTQLCAEQNITPTYILGHSAGAVVGVQLTLAGTTPPRALVGINSAFYPFDGAAAGLFPLMAKALFANPIVPRLFSAFTTRDRVDGLLDSTGSVISPEQRALYTALVMDRAHVEGALAMMANWDLHGFQPKLRQLRQPFLNLVGENDGTVPARKAPIADQAIEKAATVYRANAGHLIHEEAAHAQWCFERIEDFFPR